MIISFILIFSIKDIIFQIPNKCTSFSHVLLHHGMKNAQLLPLLCQLLSLVFSVFLNRCLVGSKQQETCLLLHLQFQRTNFAVINVKDDLHLHEIISNIVFYYL